MFAFIKKAVRVRLKVVGSTVYHKIVKPTADIFILEI